MRSSMIGLAAAAAVGISVVALPPAIAAHSTPTAISTVAAAAPAVVAAAPSLVAAPSYPVNVTTASFKPGTATYNKPTKVTFTGKLTLNGVGIRTDHLRLFSVKSHSVIGMVKTTNSGAFTFTYKVNSSDIFFAMFSGNTNYQPALSGVSRITIGNRAAKQ